MTLATLSSKNQITLPTELRRLLGIRPGDTIGFFVEGSHAVLRAVPKSDFVAFARAFRKKHKLAGKIDVKKALTERAQRRYGKGR